ncbi:MAG: nucleotidyl transferase AbiEii/AbiGii toxin family protein, partial [Patescibacteria group bacterium]
MHKEILTKNQADLLFIPKMFSKNFGLVGGTAIALYIGHRESLDFDLFSLKEFDNDVIRRKISKIKKIDYVVRDEEGQFTLLIDKIRFTFFHYPYKLNFSKKMGDIIKMPD